MREKVMCERPFFLGSAHEHRNGCANALIYVNDEYFLFVAEKDRTAAAGRDNGSHLGLDNRLTHSPKPNQTALRIKIGIEMDR